MRLVPTPIRNNPTSACMSHPLGINSFRSPALKDRDQSTRLGGFSYILPIIAEARFQASDDLRFEAAHMIRRFFSQATMKLLRQAKTNYPMSRPSFHQDKASDNRSYRQADDETSDNSNRDGHGDTTSNRTKRTIMLMATLRTVATNNSHTRPSTGAARPLQVVRPIIDYSRPAR